MTLETAQRIQKEGEDLGLKFTVYPVIKEGDVYAVACPKTLYLNEDGARRELEVLRAATCEG